mgnify:CR=1 FL=1
MIGKTMFSLVLVLIGIRGNAQDIHIRGFVEDLESGEKLPAVHIQNIQTSHGTTTNESGYYSLAVPVTSGTLIVSYIGYKTDTISWSATSDTVVHVQMRNAVELETVTVISGRNESLAESPQTSQAELSGEEIEQIPALFGEADVLKSLQLMPGVQSGPEGTAGVYVRGGSMDQNLILVDGVPIYNPHHVLGIFSTFNSDAIQNVRMTKGGFPARFGGRLSSVIEVDLKEGNMEEFHGSGQIGLITSKVMLEGPIVPEKTSFLLSARRSYTDLIAKPLLRNIESNTFTSLLPSSYFHDINIKISHRFNETNDLIFSGYMGADHYGVTEEDEIETTNAVVNWGNYLGSLKWNHRLTPNIFTNLAVTFSRYRLENDIEYTFTKNDIRDYFNSIYQSGIDDLGINYSLRFLAGNHHDVRLGMEWTHHRYTPGALTYGYELEKEIKEARFNQEGLQSKEGSFYLEDVMEYGPFRMNAGVHFSQFFTDGQLYHSVQPRVSMRFLIAQKWALKASYAQMQQYINLLASESLSLPTDLWVPSTKRIQPQTSWQGVFGLVRTMGQDFELSVEGYYKEMDKVLSYQPGVSFILDVASTNDWQDKISQGRGWAYGGEFRLEKKAGKTTGWASYTLAWNYRQFDNINQGTKFPFKYDRRHDISIVLSHELSPRWSISGIWVYGSGNAYSLPDTYLPVPEEYFGHPASYLVYDQKNHYRMSDYHRLDFSLTRNNERKWGSTNWVFGVYNAYFRNNPFYVSQDRNGTVREVSVLPIIPYVSWGFNF